jgi:hypothetical protein
MIQPIEHSFFRLNVEETKQFLFKWTPRALVVGIGAYYGLGIAYEIGLMAAIDKIAIGILKKSVGYVGIGALMPTVQWYSSIGVRIAMGTAAALGYDLCLRIANHTSWLLRSRSSQQPFRI